MKLDDVIEQAEQHIRQGRVDIASDLIKELNIKQIPDRYRLKVANLCRRSGLNRRGLMTLSPFFAQERGVPTDEQDPKWVAEYSILLMRYGVVREGLQRLEELKDSKEPDLLMAKTLCHLNLWDHKAAAAAASQYLKNSLDPYQQLVGQMNLAAALLMETETPDSVLDLLEKATEIARKSGHLRLLGNCYELRAQYEIQKNRYTDAIEALEEALRLLEAVRPREYYYVRKWKVIAEAFLSGKSDDLLAFRTEALQEQQWETVRSLDLYILKLEFDPRRFQYLYVGTPYESFRNWICARLGQQAPSMDYIYGNLKGEKLDLISGSLRGKTVLKPGHLSHSVVRFLFSDFYKPRRLGEIFSNLFADEVFDSYSSPDRVQKAVGRARAELRDQGIPITIEEIDNAYRCRLTDTFCVALGEAPQELNAQAVALMKIRESFAKDTYFKGKEIQDLLQVSKATVQRLLLDLIDKKHLSVSGVGKATRYKLM